MNELSKPTHEQLEEIIGNKELVLFFLAWLKNKRNATKAYLELHPDVTYARVWFKEGDNFQKRAILHALGSDLRIDGKILSIQQHKPFMIVNGMKERYGILLETIGPEDSLATVTQKMGSEGATTSLLPG